MMKPLGNEIYNVGVALDLRWRMHSRLLPFALPMSVYLLGEVEVVEVREAVLARLDMEPQERQT